MKLSASILMLSGFWTYFVKVPIIGSAVAFTVLLVKMTADILIL